MLLQPRPASRYRRYPKGADSTSAAMARALLSASYLRSAQLFTRLLATDESHTLLPLIRTKSSISPTASNSANQPDVATPRRRSASESVSCGSWRLAASCWWPLTCRSRPSAGWRSPAMCFVLYRPSGSTDRFVYRRRERGRPVTLRANKRPIKKRFQHKGSKVKGEVSIFRL